MRERSSEQIDVAGAAPSGSAMVEVTVTKRSLIAAASTTGIARLQMSSRHQQFAATNAGKEHENPVIGYI